MNSIRVIPAPNCIPGATSVTYSASLFGADDLDVRWRHGFGFCGHDGRRDGWPGHLCARFGLRLGNTGGRHQGRCTSKCAGF